MRNIKTEEIKKGPQIQDKNNEKKIISTTTIQKISTGKKPIEISKSSNISSTTIIEKKEIRTTKQSYMKTEEATDLSMDKPSKFRVYLSSRYRGSKQNENDLKINDQIASFGETEKNIHILNPRKSPDNISYKKNIFETEKEIKNMNYNIKNTLLEQNSGSAKDIFDKNQKDYFMINNTSPNNKRFRQPMIPQNKMSPIKQYYDDGNSLIDNKRTSVKNSRNTNNIITNINTESSKIESVKLNTSNINYNNREIRSPISTNTGEINFTSPNSPGYKSKSPGLSYKELKRIVKKFNKVYDPYKNEKGLLIKQSQVTLPGAQDEIFNNRYRVLSKMNKLSNILLAKQRKIDEDDNYDENNYKKDSRYEINTKMNKGKKKDKLFLSLAMISGKMNMKDKVILRNMRNEKGGVVDLAQEDKKKNKFKIKKVTKVSGMKLKVNKKDQEKAAKIIQSWWKELKDIYNYKLSQIIKIQSVWKARWVRKNIYDLLYLNYLYLSFCEKIEKILRMRIIKNVFDKLKKKKNKDDENSEEEKEIREEINLNGKKVIKITKITEKERYISPGRKDGIIEKDKFKGLLKIIEGVNSYHKKQAFSETKPKIINYLTFLVKKEKLKKILIKKIQETENIIKKYFYKWVTKTTIINSNLEKNNDNEKDRINYSNLKTKIFLRRIENVKNKQKKTILRKYFYRYLKNVLLIGKKEERQKVLYFYKSDTESHKNFTNYFKSKNMKNIQSNMTYKNALYIKKIGFDSISNHLEGCKILEKYSWRNTYEDILESFKNQQNREKINNHMIRIIKIKETIKQKIIKKYFTQWKNNTSKKQKNDLISKLFIKIIKIIIENRNKKILSKKFYQWQKIVNMLKEKDNIFLKSKGTYDFIVHIKKFINKKFANSFIENLKVVKKHVSYIEVLKKIIINQKNKKKNKLLKKAFNKWRNKVTDYEIGKLKGKLLLKIYEKYKTTKIKEILKKMVNKWENNTIFIDTIKNKINQENIDNFTKTTTQNKITIILKSTIRNINRKNNDIILRKYFNNWKKNIEDKNKGIDAEKILKDNKKITSLKNILFKYGRLIPIEKIKHLYFTKWMFINKKLAQIENSNIIQNFCTQHLKSRLKVLKWKKLKKLLQNKIRKKNTKDILNVLKKYISIIKLVQILKGNNNKTIFYKKFIEFFFERLSNVKEKYSSNNTNILKRIIIRVNNKKKNNLLKNAFNKWRNKVADYEIGRLKGKLLLKIYDKYKDNKIKDILKKVIYKWKNNTVFKNIITNNYNKIIILFKSVIRNINRKNNVIILRKFFNRWQKIIEDKYKAKILKDNKKITLLKNIIYKYGKLIARYKIKHYYFAKWLYINRYLKQIENSNIIQNFCTLHLKSRINVLKWKKLNRLLKNRTRKNHIKAILKILKRYIGIIKLFNLLERNSKRNIFYKKFIAFFLNRLMVLKERSSPRQMLKKLIIRKNNKMRHILLKNALNKWRNKVSGYEIGKLKGKLLLKIYDKYKINKIKDILKKKLNKWENNTIFIYQIKTKITQENIDIFTRRNYYNNIIILLKSILRNINRKNNDTILRLYFNKWKRIVLDKNKNLELAGKHLLKINKVKNIKYFFNKLKKIRKVKILKKLLIKHGRSKSDIIGYYFSRWKYKNKKLEQIENAQIIQKFCKNILKNSNISNKWKKLYLLLKIKNRNNNIRRLLKLLKKYLGVIKLFKLLERNNKGNVFYKKFIALFLNKLNSLRGKDYSLKHILKRIIIRKNNKKKHILLKNALNKWRNKVADYEIGRLKGKLLLKMYDKYKDNKIKDILKKILRKWEDNAIFIYQIKTKITKENIDIFTRRNNYNKIIILLKSILRNINRKNNDIILRKFLNRWQKNVNDKNKNMLNARNHILKYIKKTKGKYFFDKLKDNRKRVKLNKIIKKHAKPKELILDCYFKKWIYINKLLKQVENAKIIQNFCRVEFKNRLNKNKWKKLYLLLRRKNKKNNIKDILRLLKNYIGMKKLSKTLIKNNKRNIFNKLKSQKNTKKIKLFLIEILETLEYINDQNLLKKYLTKWKNIIRKKNNKEDALEYMMYVLENKKLKNSVNNLSNVFLIGKLLKDIPKMRALHFLRKIKKDGKYNKLYKILAYDLVDTREHLLKQNKIPIIDKILKIYAYKILSNLFDYLDKIKRKQNILYMEDFFYKLYQNNIKNAKYKYIKQNKVEKMPNIVRGMTFKIKKSPKVKRDEKSNKTIVYKRLTPFLVKYLNKKFNNIKFDVFDKIRYNNKADKFCQLLKTFSRKTQIPDKEDLVDSLKYYVYMKLSKLTTSNKLYNLMRRAIIRRILNISKIVGNYTRVEQLIKITITHRNISKDRWILYLIRRWRFVTFIKKMAMKKMELMYQDLHVTYLEMADNVLNERAPMGPYDRRFLPDIKMEKYLYDFNDPFLVKGSQPYQCIKKQYVFKPLDAEFEKKTSYTKEIKTIDKITQNNSVYYDYNYNNINIKGVGNKNYIEGKNINNITIKETKYIKESPKVINKTEVKTSIKEDGNYLNINETEKNLFKKKEGFNIIKNKGNNSVVERFEKGDGGSFSKNVSEKGGNIYKFEKKNSERVLYGYVNKNDDSKEIKLQKEYIKNDNKNNNNNNSINKNIKSSYFYSSNLSFDGPIFEKKI